MRPVVEGERDAAASIESHPNTERPPNRRRDRGNRGSAPDGSRANHSERTRCPRAHARIVSPVSADVALGALAAGAAAICYETSYVVQALEARRVPLGGTIEVSLLTRLMRRPRWLGAIALAAVGWPLQLLALALAPLTLVQPVIALGIVFLLVLASRVLHERIEAGAVVCCAGVVLGVAGIAWAAPERSSSHAGPAALGLALGVLGAFVAVPYAAAALGRSLIPALWLVVAAGAGDAWAAFGAKILVDELSRAMFSLALGFAAASGAALAAGLLSETSALQRYPASRVGPAVLAMQVAIPVILAGLVGGESWGDTPLDGAAVVGSLALVMVSGGLLARSRAIVSLREHDRRGRGEPRVIEVGGSSRLERAHEC
jgi:drug/metabolite transporter (DMT)-like permease